MNLLVRVCDCESCAVEHICTRNTHGFWTCRDCANAARLTSGAEDEPDIFGSLLQRLEHLERVVLALNATVEDLKRKQKRQ